MSAQSRDNRSSLSSSKQVNVRRWKPSGAKHQPTQGDLLGFKKLDADLYLANQLFRAGCRVLVTAGVTGFTERRERIRREIEREGMADRCLKDAHGNQLDETFAEAFARLYNEPLRQPTQGEFEC